MVKKTFHSIRSFYDLFRSGLTGAEIEKLFSQDTRGMYAFYVRNVPPRDPSQSKAAGVLKFLWYLFLAFLLKLTPARRLFYALALVLIAMAFWDSDLMKALYGFLIINFLLALELADKLVTRDELEFARQIQLSLLPDELLPVQGFSLASYSEVAQSVGGDYYDLLPLNDGSTLAIIGDVSGKGISAALYMVKVQTALQLLAKETADPRDLMVRLNEYLSKQFRRNYFLTISIVRMRTDGVVQLCRAGHTPGLLVNARRRTGTWLQPGGTAIGLPGMERGSRKRRSKKENGTVFARSLEIQRMTMRPGDLLVLYTDGVVETINRRKEEFGQQRLRDAVVASADEEPEEVKAKLIERLNAFRQGEELRDDTTFVVIRRSG